MKVELIITRKGVKIPKVETYEVSEKDKSAAKKAAKLIFLNEYINRDANIQRFDCYETAKMFLDQQGIKNSIKIKANIKRQ